MWMFPSNYNCFAHCILAHGIVNDDINNLTIIWCMLITTMSCIFHYHWTLISTQRFTSHRIDKLYTDKAQGLIAQIIHTTFSVPIPCHSFLGFLWFCQWKEYTAARQSHNSAFVNMQMNRKTLASFLGLPCFFVCWFVLTIIHRSVRLVKMCSFASVYYFQHKPKNEKWGRAGNEAMHTLGWDNEHAGNQVDYLYWY